MNIYEMQGRTNEMLANAQQTIADLTALIASIKDGKVAIERVVIEGNVVKVLPE